MITPHIALMFRVFASEVRVDIMEAMYEKIERVRDITKSTGHEHSLVIHHIAYLLRMGLVEPLKNDDKGFIIDQGYKLTFKGFEAIKNINKFSSEVEKLVV